MALEMHADVIYVVRLQITIDLYFRVSFSDLFGEYLTNIDWSTG